MSRTVGLHESDYVSAKLGISSDIDCMVPEVPYHRRMPEGRIEHPHLLSFFNGAYDLLLGAFAASGDMSSETKGNMREQLVRETLANVLPPFVRLEAGDIIDSEGHRTGQLDNVAIENRSPTLKLSPTGNGFILAEGAVAVVELKSDVSKQWSEVQTLFRNLIPVAPYDWAVTHGGHADRVVPLFVIGADGWANDDTAIKHVTDLAGTSGNDPTRHIFVINLRRRILVAHVAQRTDVLTFSADQRGGIVGELVLQLTARARALAVRPIPYRAYAQKRRSWHHESPDLYEEISMLVTSPRVPHDDASVLLRPSE